MKAVVAAFNQEKNLRMELFQALHARSRAALCSEEIYMQLDTWLFYPGWQVKYKVKFLRNVPTITCCILSTAAGECNSNSRKFVRYNCFLFKHLDNFIIHRKQYLLVNLNIGLGGDKQLRFDFNLDNPYHDKWVISSSIMSELDPTPRQMRGATNIREREQQISDP